MNKYRIPQIAGLVGTLVISYFVVESRGITGAMKTATILLGFVCFTPSLIVMLKLEKQEAVDWPFKALVVLTYIMIPIGIYGFFTASLSGMPNTAALVQAQASLLSIVGGALCGALFLWLTNYHLEGDGPEKRAASCVERKRLDVYA